MNIIARNLFTIIGIACAAIVLNVEKMGDFYLFAPPDRMYIDAVISALIVSEGLLLDATLRRRAKERMMSAVLKSVNEALARERGELQESLTRIRLLSGLLPICSSCKRIRDEEGKWRALEEYISAHYEAQFTHGICPECRGRIYPGVRRPDSPPAPAGL